METNYVESKELYEYIKENKELKDFFDLISVMHLKVTENVYADYIKQQISLNNKKNENYLQIEKIINNMPQFSANSKLKFYYIDTTITKYYELAKESNSPLDYFEIFYNCVTSLFLKEDIEYMREYVLENQSSNAEIKLESPAEKDFREFSSIEKQLKKMKKSSKRKCKILYCFDMNLPGKLDAKISHIITKSKEDMAKATDELSQGTWLTERNEFFENIDFQTAKDIIDSYDLFCAIVDEYIKNSESLRIVLDEFEDYKRTSWLNVIDLIIDSDSISQEQYKNITFELFKFFASDNKISDDFKREEITTSFNTLAVQYFLEYKKEDITSSFNEFYPELNDKINLRKKVMKKKLY